MGKLIIICIVLYGFWVIGYALYEMSRKGKKKPSKTGLKDPHRELSVEQILGKCRSVECHSQPQVRSYPEHSFYLNLVLFICTTNSKPICMMR